MISLHIGITSFSDVPSSWEIIPVLLIFVKFIVKPDAVRVSYIIVSFAGNFYLFGWLIMITMKTFQSSVWAHEMIYRSYTENNAFINHQVLLIRSIHMNIVIDMQFNLTLTLIGCVELASLLSFYFLSSKRVTLWAVSTALTLNC